MSEPTDAPKSPPFFVWDGDDIKAFRTVERLESYLEAEDVRSGAYSSVYDSDGRRYQLTVASRPALIGFGRTSTAPGVSIRPVQGAPADLETLLSKFGSYAEGVSLCGMNRDEIRALSPKDLVDLVTTATVVG